MDEIFADWAKAQFDGLAFGDERLNKRAQLIAGNMMKKPEASINKQNEAWKEAKGAYRFFDSEKVNFQELIRPHKESVKAEASLLDIVLAIQDTCYIGYGHHPSVKGLGHIGKEDSKGVILHNTLAVNPSSSYAKVIGVLDQWIHNRTDEKDESWKETGLWVEASKRIDIDTTKTKVVEVMDREGAVHKIMKNCLELNHDFLIRSKDNRIVRNPFKHKLFDAAAKTKPSGYLEIKVPKKKGQKKRTAKLEVKFLPIEIPGPPGNKDDTIECNLVQAVEINPPKNQEPLSWFLFTSVDVNSFEDAITIIRWYKHRWIIEEYHKCLKTGCNIQKKQFEEAFRIESFLGIACVIAVKLLQIRDMARIIPERRAIGVIDPLSLKVLQAYHHKRHNLSKEGWTVKDYYFNLAKLGGFLARKSDGNPGWKTLWEGQQQLHWMVEGVKTMMTEKEIYG